MLLGIVSLADRYCSRFGAFRLFFCWLLPIGSELLVAAQVSILRQYTLFVFCSANLRENVLLFEDFQITLAEMCCNTPIPAPFPFVLWFELKAALLRTLSAFSVHGCRPNSRFRELEPNHDSYLCDQWQLYKTFQLTLSYWVEKMDYFEDNYRLNALLLLKGRIKRLLQNKPS